MPLQRGEGEDQQGLAYKLEKEREMHFSGRFPDGQKELTEKKNRQFNMKKLWKAVN